MNISLDNSSSVDAESSDGIPEVFKMAIHNVRMFTAVGGLLANVLLLVLFRHYQELRTPANDFILSLAVSDVLSLVVDLAFLVRGESRELDLPCFLENVPMLMTVVNIGQLIAIAVERFLFIAKPLHYYRIITKCKRWLILFSWAGPFAMWVPMIQWVQCQQQHPMLLMGTLGSYMLAGFLIIAGLYYYVFSVARRQMHEIRSSTPGVAQPTNSANIRCHLRLLRGYLLIVGTTFVAYSLPICVFCVAILRLAPYNTLLFVQHFSAAFATLNNGINPFVYFFSQQAFKECARRLFRESVAALGKDGLRRRRRGSIQTRTINNSYV